MSLFGRTKKAEFPISQIAQGLPMIALIAISFFPLEYLMDKNDRKL